MTELFYELQPNVKHILELSVEHAPLDEYERAVDRGDLCIYPFEFGWFMFIAPYAKHEEIMKDFPALLRCVELAKDMGCDYVIFDSDLNPIEGLEKYEY